MILLVAGTIAFAVALHRPRAPVAVRHRAEALLGVLLAQGALGYAQYFSDVPPLLVGIHVAGAAACWIAVLVLVLGRGSTPSPPWCRGTPIATRPTTLGARPIVRRTDRARVSTLAISAEALARRFGNIDAVPGVDLDIAPGEIYGFLGPNGAGKSTTVRMLCTLLTPSGGRARWPGSTSSTTCTRFACRSASHSRRPRSTRCRLAAQLLRLQSRLYGLSTGVERRSSKALAELVDIADFLEHRIEHVFRGMQRRLDLAVSIVHEPTVLFLDEPTTGLDPGGPHPGVARGAHAQRGAVGHDLPHHPVPRRGRLRSPIASASSTRAASSPRAPLRSSSARSAPTSSSPTSTATPTPPGERSPAARG